VVLSALARKIEPVRWECCLTCLLSDYSPAGVDLMGMRCHRDARSRYLAVRSKRDYWVCPSPKRFPSSTTATRTNHASPGQATGAYRGQA
jgi:hypothetical protein